VIAEIELNARWWRKGDEVCLDMVVVLVALQKMPNKKCIATEAEWEPQRVTSIKSVVVNEREGGPCIANIKVLSLHRRVGTVVGFWRELSVGT